MEFNAYVLIVPFVYIHANRDQSAQLIRRALHYASGNR